MIIIGVVFTRLVSSNGCQGVHLWFCVRPLAAPTNDLVRRTSWLCGCTQPAHSSSSCIAGAPTNSQLHHWLFHSLGKPHARSSTLTAAYAAADAQHNQQKTTALGPPPQTVFEPCSQSASKTTTINAKTVTCSHNLNTCAHHCSDNST